MKTFKSTCRFYRHSEQLVPIQYKLQYLMQHKYNQRHVTIDVIYSQISIHPTKLIKIFGQIIYLRADILLYLSRNQLNNAEVTHKNSF